MSSLKEFIRSIIDSFLGPNKSCKFIVENKDVCITRCPLHVFQNSCIQDSLSPLIEETLFAHHEFYGCSTLSLLTMWYLWYEEFKLALEEGYEMQDIIVHSQDILELVISSLSDITISIHSLLTVPKHRYEKKVPFKKLNAFGQLPVSVQYSSRHFSPSQSTLLSNDENEEYHKEISEFEENSLKMVIQRLDHDGDNELSNLVLESWKKQISFTGCLEFKADGLHICPIILPSSNSTVVDGLVIKCNSNYTYSKDRKNINISRTLIIQGSITFEYVHLGFSPKVLITHHKSLESPSISEREKWRRKCCEFILKLKIDVLLVKDDVDPEIATFCSSHSILVLSQIELQVFKMLCCALEYSPCKYIWDCNEDCISKNLTIRLWETCNSEAFDSQYFLCTALTTNKVLLQTIVVCSFSQAILERTKHQLQHLISRLNMCFQSKKLLPGGEVEEWCSSFLRKSFQTRDLRNPRNRIIIALADGFLNYSNIVSHKKALSTEPSVRTLDEKSSKLSAWRSALSLVLLILQCDTAIINGVSEISKQIAHL